MKKAISVLVLTAVGAGIYHFAASGSVQKLFKHDRGKKVVSIWDGRIIKGYGNGKKNTPENNQWEFHSGVDIEASPGAPVAAATDGVISSVGWDENLGDVVIISAGDKTFKYAKCIPGVRIGQNIKKKDILGHVSKPDKNENAHLHFEVAVNGVQVDPLEWKKQNYYAVSSPAKSNQKVSSSQQGQHRQQHTTENMFADALKDESAERNPSGGSQTRVVGALKQAAHSSSNTHSSTKAKQHTGAVKRTIISPTSPKDSLADVPSIPSGVNNTNVEILPAPAPHIAEINSASKGLSVPPIKNTERYGNVRITARILSSETVCYKNYMKVFVDGVEKVSQSESCVDDSVTVHGAEISLPVGKHSVEVKGRSCGAFKNCDSETMQYWLDVKENDTVPISITIHL
ncbi:MAG TPA: M23 family metallopeptidase [bacterium]|nr:M23 family metallopeptidase [bacterium]